MALVALTTNTLTKPRRIEGHTSNVETPIYYSQMGTITSATLGAGASFVLPHQFVSINHINVTPLDAAGAGALYGAASGAATLGAYIDKNGYAVDFEVLGAASTAGATTVTLGSSASAVNDVYNNCTLDIEHLSGQRQTVKILDYVGSTKVATIATGLEAAVTTSTKYRVRGSIFVSPTGATTPSFSFEVMGSL